MFLKSVSVLSLISLASCGPLARSANMVLHEQREDIPDGFVQSGPAPADQLVNLRLALVQGDMATLEQKLFDVSTPSSSLYGQHLTKEEVGLFSLSHIKAQ